MLVTDLTRAFSVVSAIKVFITYLLILQLLRHSDASLYVNMDETHWTEEIEDKLIDLWQENETNLVPLEVTKKGKFPQINHLWLS